MIITWTFYRRSESPVDPSEPMATDSPPSAEQLAPHSRDVTIPTRERSPSALLIKSEARERDDAGNLNFRGLQGPQTVNSEEAVAASDNKLVIDEEENQAGNDLMKSESGGEQRAPQSNKLESPFAEKEGKAKGEEAMEGEDERLEVS